MVKEKRNVRRIRLSAEDRVFGAVTYILATLFMLVCAYPLIYVLSASISNPALIVSGKIILLPKEIQFRAYEAVFKSEDVLLGYKNAVFYAFAGTAINIVLTTAGAYVLSRPDLWGRTAVTFLISFTMFFSGGMIPTYITIKNLGMINTVWAMLLPGAGSATNLLIITACIMPLYSFSHCTYFTLRSGGKTIITFLFDCGYTWAISVPLALLMVKVARADIVVCFANVEAANIIKCLIGYIFVRSGKWIQNLTKCDGIEAKRHGKTKSV